MRDTCSTNEELRSEYDQNIINRGKRITNMCADIGVFDDASAAV
jgi:hypothetical protein